MLAFARMSPKHSANKFAEGLINPNVGRGANYISVMKMKENLNIIIEYPNRTSSSEYVAAIKYCNDLEENGVVLKDKKGTIKYLTEINDVLQAISNKGCGNSVPVYDLFGPVEAPRKVFVSDFDINSIPDVLEPCWNLFKANADKLIDSFNPVYDLFAGYVMVGIIKGEDRTNHSREEFLKNVVTEF